jgi:putative peptide zinc metalloprotease protein
VIRTVNSPAGDCHRLKDPITLRYFEFTAEEYFVWAQLRPGITLGELRQRCEAEFAPRQVSTGELQRFVLELLENRLITRREPPAQPARTMADPSPGRPGSSIATSWSALLFHRFRGLNPTPFLDRLVQLIKACPRLLVRALLLAPPVAALWLLLSDAERLRVDQTPWLQAQDSTVWIATAVVLWLCRGVHEAAHGVACRWQGAECPELGVQWLLFSPVLYCDVSDTWLLASRASRVLVTAAGPLADIWLAACGWLIAEATTVESVQAIARLVALFCIANTLLLNGNPLLKYDGYHVLCDLADEPNLSDKARGWWLERCAAVGLGIHPVASSAGRVRHPGLVACYGLAAAIYRPWIWGTLIMTTSAWFTQSGYPQLALLAAALLLLAILGPWLAGLLRTLRHPLFWSRLESGRFRVTVGVLAALVAAACLVPLPRSVPAIARVDAPNSQPLYVVVPGRLDMAVPAGTTVQQGELLAKLSNPELLRQRERLWAEVQQLEFRLSALEARRLEAPQDNLPVSATGESLRAARQQLSQLDADLSRLEFRAASAGQFWPPPWQPGLAGQPEIPPTWSGSPLARLNQGCWLEVGTMLGQLGTPADLSILLELEGADADLIHVGQAVRVVLDHAVHRQLNGVIAQVGLPVLRGERPATPPTSLPPPRSVVVARMVADHDPDRMLLRDSGSARISVAWTPLATRVWDALQASFRLPVAPRR